MYEYIEFHRNLPFVCVCSSSLGSEHEQFSQQLNHTGSRGAAGQQQNLPIDDEDYNYDADLTVLPYISVEERQKRATAFGWFEPIEAGAITVKKGTEKIRRSTDDPENHEKQKGVKCTCADVVNFEKS